MARGCWRRQMIPPSDAARDRTCTARAVVRSIHRTTARAVKKLFFFLVPFRPSFSALWPLFSAASPETWKWLIQVLRDLKVTHPSLERLESDSSKSWETWKWLIQVSRDLKVTHPSLERLENDSSKSWETWKWLIKTINLWLSLNPTRTMTKFLRHVTRRVCVFFYFNILSSTLFLYFIFNFFCIFVLQNQCRQIVHVLH